MIGTSLLSFLNIVCHKWGDSYSPNDVNILYASVKRNLSVPFRFFCISDNKEGLNPEVIFAPMPYTNLPGSGPKLYSFSEEVLGLSKNDYLVSLDLDIVIVDSLDFLAEQPEFDFVIAKHRASKSVARAHGAVYRIKVGSHKYLWDEFIANPEAVSKRFPASARNPMSEQNWLEYHFAEREFNFFPEGKILIFRVDCSARSCSYFLGREAGRLGLTTAYWGRASLPDNGESIVSFSGRTQPSDVMHKHHGHLKQAPFVVEHWRL